MRQQSLWWVKDLSLMTPFSFQLQHPVLRQSRKPVDDHYERLLPSALRSNNNQLSGVQGQMKYMAYIMPVMLLGIFNSLPAALTYYYSVSNVVAFAQQFIIKNYVIDEAKIHRQIQENKKKPVKRSKWQQRLEICSELKAIVANRKNSLLFSVRYLKKMLSELFCFIDSTSNIVQVFIHQLTKSTNMRKFTLFISALFITASCFAQRTVNQIQAAPRSANFKWVQRLVQLR